MYPYVPLYIPLYPLSRDLIIGYVDPMGMVHCLVCSRVHREGVDQWFRRLVPFSRILARGFAMGFDGPGKYIGVKLQVLVSSQRDEDTRNKTNGRLTKLNFDSDIYTC